MMQAGRGSGTAVGSLSCVIGGGCVVARTQKGLFDPFTGYDAAVSVLSLFATFTASGGGLGGGGMLVPFMILLYRVDAVAIPLSKATIFGSAIGSLIANLRLRHPLADRPMMDMGVALMLEPATLVGTVAGVLLNRFFPSWLITFLLIAVLGFTAYRTMRKVRQERSNLTLHSVAGSPGVH